MNKRIGACEQCKQGGASEWESGASERANGRASGPVLYMRLWRSHSTLTGTQKDGLQILDVGGDGTDADFRHVRVDRLQQHVVREDVLILRLDQVIPLLTNVFEET